MSLSCYRNFGGEEKNFIFELKQVLSIISRNRISVLSISLDHKIDFRDRIREI